MSRLNNKLVRQAFARAAIGFDDADFFHQEIRERLLERLDWVNLGPDVVIDVGAGTLRNAHDLHKRYPEALLLGLDFSEAMLGAAETAGVMPLCARAENMPLNDQVADLVLSNLFLHWAQDPERVIAECSRLLKTSGLFSFTTLGPGSFIELRSAWAEVDDYPHVHDFEDMHNIGDALIKAGLQEPVMDSEVITVSYATLGKLVQDLRGIGATNHAVGARAGLTGSGSWQAMEAALEKFRNAEGRLQITLEVIYGHAWKLRESHGISPEDGVVNFPLDRLRRNMKG